MTEILTWPQISRLLPRIDLMAAIEDGFAAYSRGDAIVPPVGELLFPSGEAHIKYGYIKGDPTFAVKVATGFYDNPKIGLSSSNGVVVLFEAKTGVPAAIFLDEGKLTDIRTAIAGAIAAKYLAPRTVEAIGVIGTGIQARLQVKHLRAVTSCRKLRVFGRSREALESYCREMQEDGFDAIVCESAAQVASRSNLIVTTTAAKEPLLMACDIRPGTHITAVGADTADKNEIDPEIFKKADRIVADSIGQCLTRGELHHAVDRGFVDRDRIVELGSIINSDASGRKDESEITIADLTGVAVQDIRIAQAVLAGMRAERDTA
jgi:ornithine cyclodeaminase